MNFGGTVKLNPFGLCILIATCFLLLLYVNSGSNFDVRKEKSSMISLKELLKTAIQASVMGGKEVIKVKSKHNLNEKSKGKTHEGKNDPVTDADFNSHCVMFQTLSRAFPNVKVISEEKPQHICRELQSEEFVDQTNESHNSVEDVSVNADDITIWIDPLDATQEYIDTLLQYVTTMVCVAVKGLPTIGVIHQPFIKSETTWAWVDHGRSSNLVGVGQIPREKQIIVSRSHAGEVRNITRKAFGSDFDVIQAGGAGYKVLQVASGNVSAYVHVTAIKKWDICAGNAILDSLGGSMTTIAGDLLNYSSTAPTINTGGLLATLHDHSWFSGKLRKFFNKN